MEKMKLCKADTWGYDFLCALPYYWWTFNFSSQRYIKFEILCRNGYVGDVSVKVSPCGEYFYVSEKIPTIFLSVARQIPYYTPPTDNAAMLPNEPSVSESDAIFANLHRGMNEVRNALNLQPAVPVMRVKLPFKCSVEFQDPYHQNQTGYAMTSWPHESDATRRVYVYSACMREALALSSKPRATNADMNLNPDLSAQFDG